VSIESTSIYYYAMASLRLSHRGSTLRPQPNVFVTYYSGTLLLSPQCLSPSRSPPANGIALSFSLLDE